jgi:hypothetical protein
MKNSSFFDENNSWDKEEEEDLFSSSDCDDESEDEDVDENYSEYEEENLDEEIEDEEREDEYEESSELDDIDEAVLEHIEEVFEKRNSFFKKNHVDIESLITYDNLLDFHVFISSARGICKGEKNFFNRMKLRYFNKN